MNRNTSTLPGILGVLLLSAGLLAVAQVAQPISNGILKSDLNANGHSLTNAATISATNIVATGTISGNGAGLTNVSAGSSTNALYASQAQHSTNADLATSATYASQAGHSTNADGTGGVAFGSAATNNVSAFAPAGSGVTSFNTRTGSITLTASDVNATGTINVVNTGTATHAPLSGISGLGTGVSAALGVGVDAAGGLALANLNIIYVSQISGIHQNSNVLTGGGTDDTTAIQTALNTASAQGNVILVQDGASLVSGLYSTNGNTTVYCPNQNCGFYLANNSNRELLSENFGLSQSATQTGTISNVQIIGGTYNGNGANQAKYYGNGSSSTTPFTLCLVFARTNNLVVRDVNCVNSKNYAFTFDEVNNVDIENCQNTQTGTPTVNQDGLHFFQASNVFCRNFQNGGGDDVVACNTDEAVYSATTYSPTDNRFPTSGGAESNLTFENIYSSTATGLDNMVRFIGYTTTGGVTTISQAKFCNLYGQKQHGVQAGGVTLSNITFDGFYANNAGTALSLGSWTAAGAYVMHVLAGTTVSSVYSSTSSQMFSASLVRIGPGNVGGVSSGSLTVIDEGGDYGTATPGTNWKLMTYDNIVGGTTSCYGLGVGVDNTRGTLEVCSGQGGNIAFFTSCGLNNTLMGNWYSSGGLYIGSSGTATDPGAGNVAVTGALKMLTTQTAVAGSTSGTVTFSEPFAGSSYKKVVASMSSTFAGTATFTLPTAFSNTPVVVNSDAAVTTDGTGTVVLTGTGTLPRTVVLEGF